MLTNRHGLEATKLSFLLNGYFKENKITPRMSDQTGIVALIGIILVLLHTEEC